MKYTSFKYALSEDRISSLYLNKCNNTKMKYVILNETNVNNIVALNNKKQRLKKYFITMTYNKN